MSEQPHQSLYRQYRPQRFAEVRGQDHVTRALRNAVRANRFGHAYLFSGPRGTGKTSTARILAKALNCTALDEGEPCGACPSCLAIQGGSSLDVLELDAASNNGVDAMRDLVARAALGTPGRWKVYIVDEVHMLSTPASNALLKTLEEPPGHVVFVLATTDPQKVLPTIRSRAQHFEFHLLGPEVLGGLVRDINADASLGVDDRVLDQVVRKGAGSARDALSALDQAVAAGGAEDEPDTALAIVEALCDRDVGRALAAVAAACQVGRDPRRVAVDVVERLRQGFLTAMAPTLVGTPAEEIPQLSDQARRLGTPALVRAMEVLGEALVAMREALDTRVTLEVALVRLCAPEADTSVAALLERVDRLERRQGTPGAGREPVSRRSDLPPVRGAEGAALHPSEPRLLGTDSPSRGAESPPQAAESPPQAAASPPQTAASPPQTAAPPQQAVESTPQGSDSSRGSPEPLPESPVSAAPTLDRSGGVSGSRVALGALRRRAGAVDADRTASTAEPVAPVQTDLPDEGVVGGGVPTGGPVPDRDEITKAWGDSILASLPPGPRSVFRSGRWLAAEDGAAVFAVPNAFALDRAERKRLDVEAALRAHFGTPIRVRLVEEGAVPVVDLRMPITQVGHAADEESLTTIDVAAMKVADAVPIPAEERLKQAFPGSEEVPT